MGILATRDVHCCRYYLAYPLWPLGLIFEALSLRAILIYVYTYPARSNTMSYIALAEVLLHDGFLEPLVCKLQMFAFQRHKHQLALLVHFLKAQPVLKNKLCPFRWPGLCGFSNTASQSAP